MSATLEGVSEETLALIKKAQTTGIDTTTGFYGYDLSGLVHLIPVVTPFRDLVPRAVPKDGNKFAVWRAVMNVNNAQPDPSMGWDFAAAEVVVDEQDFQAKYMPTGYAGVATQDSQDLGKNYADTYAESTFQTMNQALIGDDKKQMLAQSFALKAASAPVLTQNTTGGTIGATTTVYVGVAGRTGSGYYWGAGNSKGASTSGTSGGGSANSVTATTTALRGAVAYDWFQSANGTTWWYYGTTTANTITMTSVITSNNALPSSTVCPDMTTAVPTFNASIDNGSANPNDYDGFLATLSGDYTATGQWAQPGTATANPSTWHSLDGAALTLSGGTVTEVQEYLFQPIYTAIKDSPTAIMVSSAQAQEIANLILGSTGATTFLNTDASGRISVTAGGRVGEIINAPAGGKTVPIEVHPALPPGTIIARCDRVPFPQANISSVLEQRCLRDMAQYDYATARVANTKGGGPRREFELRTVSAFVNRAPVAMGVLSNVG